MLQEWFCTNTTFSFQVDKQQSGLAFVCAFIIGNIFIKKKKNPAQVVK